MAKVFLLVLLILLSPSSDVLASDDIGYKYYLKGDYQKALKVWTKELNEGKREAMYNIALLYYFGKGVEKNLPCEFLGKTEKHQHLIRALCNYRINKNDKNPITSVIVVTKTLDASAGSILNFFSETGTIIPNNPATIIFKIIEMLMIKVKFKFSNHI